MARSRSDIFRRNKSSFGNTDSIRATASLRGIHLTEKPASISRCDKFNSLLEPDTLAK